MDSPRREFEAAAVTILMGLDQHRAQITVDWLDTETGEVSRARVMPTGAARERFLSQFEGQWEAGMALVCCWLSSTERPVAIFAEVHAAASTAALRGRRSELPRNPVQRSEFW